MFANGGPGVGVAVGAGEGLLPVVSASPFGEAAGLGVAAGACAEARATEENATATRAAANSSERDFNVGSSSDGGSHAQSADSCVRRHRTGTVRIKVKSNAAGRG